VTSLFETRAVFSFLNGLTKLFSLSISDKAMEYLFGLCRTYPDEYVQTCIWTLLIYNDMRWNFTTDSSLCRLLVDLTKECKPDSMVSNKVLRAWAIVTLYESSRGEFVKLCQQDNVFLQAFLDMVRYPDHPKYNTEDGLTPIASHLDIRGESALVWLYFSILRYLPDIIDSIHDIWPFVTNDIPYVDFVAKVKQMNADEERPTKSAANKRPREPSSQSSSELSLPSVKRTRVWKFPEGDY
jgi:hypothetical protein